MCGLAVMAGHPCERRLMAMLRSIAHRGRDGEGLYTSPCRAVGIGHRRLSIIDPTVASNQPMVAPEARAWIAFNGEIYNYRELREELREHRFRTESDTEVLLAAYLRWGEGCLDRLVGMFAFAIWDERHELLFVARDRLGIKPLYMHLGDDGELLLASEIKALHAAGVPRVPDTQAWATYLSQGLYDHGRRTFWDRIEALPAGHALTWSRGARRVWAWYDIAARVGDGADPREDGPVLDEYQALLQDSVAIHLRSDVPVGINLSGGLDSSCLLALTQSSEISVRPAKAYTFVTGDERYDELPWVEQLVERLPVSLEVCRLSPEAVPALATAVQALQDEPFGGLPTVAYAQLFRQARTAGTIVLLDGQGMDEQWAGYDYYRAAVMGAAAPIVQGSADSPVRPGCLVPEFAAEAEPWLAPERSSDAVRNLQYRDLCNTKLPRALRFNDRISMGTGTELRVPFLDHRLVELALRQPTSRKLCEGASKPFLRQLMRSLLPDAVREAPKRALQTPQREWLRGPLQAWARDLTHSALQGPLGSWFDRSRVESEWDRFVAGMTDTSFFVWQWVSLGLLSADPPSYRCPGQAELV